MCLSLTPQCARRPSIVLTRASVEQDGKWNGSIGSRLPSNLSLGSAELTPAPTTPLSMFFNEKSLPGNRSITPLLFPEHQLPVPQSTSMKRSTSEYLSLSPSRCNTPDPSQTKSLSKSQLNLKRNPNYSLFSSPSNWTDQVQYIPPPGHQPPPLIRSPSMFVNPFRT